MKFLSVAMLLSVLVALSALNVQAATQSIALSDPGEMSVPKKPDNDYIIGTQRKSLNTYPQGKNYFQQDNDQTPAISEPGKYSCGRE